MNYPPYMNMSKPNIRDYEARTVDVNIYSYYEKFSYDRRSDEEDDEEEGVCEGYQNNIDPPDGKDHWFSGYRHQPANPKIQFHELTLQDLIDFLPEGVSPKDVKVKTSVDAGDMGIYGHEVIFYYKKKVPAEPEAYKRDYAIWEKLFADWEQRNAAYEEEQKQAEIKRKQKEIRDLKERLAKLKK